MPDTEKEFQDFIKGFPKSPNLLMIVQDLTRESLERDLKVFTDFMKLPWLEQQKLLQRPTIVPPEFFDE